MGRQVVARPENGVRAVQDPDLAEGPPEVCLHGAIGDPRARAICVLASLGR